MACHPCKARPFQELATSGPPGTRSDLPGLPVVCLGEGESALAPLGSARTDQTSSLHSGDQANMDHDGDTMHHEEDTRLISFLSGLVCGAAVGAAVALLMAPEPGRKTRKRIHRAAEDLRETATDRWEDVADEVRDRVEEVLEGARKRLS